MTGKIKVIIENRQKEVKIPTGLRMLIRRCCNAVLKLENFEGSAEVSVNFVSMFFRLRDGGILCDRCYRADGSPTVSLESGVLAALRHTIYAPFEKLFSFELSPGGQKQLETAAELYVRAQMEREFKTLEFYRRISPENSFADEPQSGELPAVIKENL